MASNESGMVVNGDFLFGIKVGAIDAAALGPFVK